MGIFNILIGKQSSISITKWLDTFEMANQSLRNNDFSTCMAFIRQADSECSNLGERQDLFGISSAPGNPTGIAGLADYAIIRFKNIDFVYSLLDFIENRVGTGIALCEVWFSLFQEAIEQRRYDIAQISFSRCLGSQYRQSPKYYRISRDLLLKRLSEFCAKYTSDLNHLAELVYLQVLLEKL